MASGDDGSSDAPPLDCLVIGAGISGLLAARTLRAAGQRLLVVDKGRGVGGRMASRRLGGARVDHGAQFFTCRSREFGALVASWTAGGAAAEWCRGFGAEPDVGHVRHRGVPAMTAVPTLLAAEQQVRTGARVASLTVTPGGWTARLDGGEPIVARAVVASAPVPQTLALLDATTVRLPPALRAELELVEYAPCLAVMARLSRPSGMRPPGALAYAEPTRGASPRCLSARAPGPIVYCGDAFGGPRVEGAALSGLAAGRRAVELLGER